MRSRHRGFAGGKGRRPRLRRRRRNQHPRPALRSPRAGRSRARRTGGASCPSGDGPRHTAPSPLSAGCNGEAPSSASLAGAASPRGGARARAERASGGRIISMHSAGALASPPPGLLSLRLVPRAPRVLGSPSLAGLSAPLLAEGIAAGAARALAEDRAHRGPWLRRLARRDACSRSRGARARARAWSRRSLPPFLPPPLANAAWRSDCWTLSYSAQRDARCQGGGHSKALRSLAARRMSHDNAVNEAVASSSPCSRSFATFWRRSKSYV